MINFQNKKMKKYNDFNIFQIYYCIPQYFSKNV